MSRSWHDHTQGYCVFCIGTLPFFFSFLNGTLDVAGEVGGLLEVGVVHAMLGSAGMGALFSTSADMVLNEPHWTSGQSEIKQTAAPCSGAARSGEQMTLNTHTCFSCCLSGAEKVKWDSACGRREKRRRRGNVNTHSFLQTRYMGCKGPQLVILCYCKKSFASSC